MDAERMRRSAPDEEEDEFVTPLERFDSSGKKTAGQDGRNTGCSGLSTKSQVGTASIEKRLQSKDNYNAMRRESV
ncbi:hypothetical protein ACET3Z_001339 [Daucus carota]